MGDLTPEASQRFDRVGQGAQMGKLCLVSFGSVIQEKVLNLQIHDLTNCLIPQISQNSAKILLGMPFKQTWFFKFNTAPQPCCAYPVRVE